MDAGFIHGETRVNAAVFSEKIDTTLVLQRNYTFICKISDDTRVPYLLTNILNQIQIRYNHINYTDISYISRS